MVKKILRVEGLVFFVTALFIYHLFSLNWLLFIVFFLTPDLAMSGYLLNKQLGAGLYNIVHNYIFAVILISIGFFWFQMLLLTAGIIIPAHVGMDRFLGFGLKYPTDFKDTHLQKV